MIYKTIQVREETWKALSVLKIEMSAVSLQDVIQELIENYCKKEVKA